MEECRSPVCTTAVRARATTAEVHMHGRMGGSADGRVTHVYA